MNESDKKFLDYLSRQNLIHMQQRDSIDYLLEHFFRNYNLAPGDITKADADNLTPYKRIELLEAIRDDHEFHAQLPFGYMVGLNSLLNEIDKEGFKSADDM